MMRVLAALVGIVMAFPAVSQDSGKVDNGTDPTRLSRTFFTSYETIRVPGGLDIGTFSLRYTVPVTADKRTAVQFRLPIVQSDFDTRSGLATGDFTLRLTRVVQVTRTHGIVAQADLAFDTADRPALGTGTETLKLTGIYAIFLKDGAIFAPALAHTERIGRLSAGRADISNTAIDFYYVPRLANPRMYVTVDPAIAYDWETDHISGALAVTVGHNIETASKGTASLFIKPSIGIGQHRLFDGGVEVGLKVVGF